ncbi:MAG: preprotein translocase subunit YajC [Eubacteriales bacterium]|nr:preprotein translocase subunit YajC [Eubacteriales bacterium]
MSTSILIIYIIVLIGVFYFVGIAPQKKERQKKEELMASLAVGDYVLTTAGMYGQIIDITSDMVIIEFGGKNCRIPMLKAAIQSVEKPDVMATGEVSEEAKKADK